MILQEGIDEEGIGLWPVSERTNSTLKWLGEFSKLIIKCFVTCIWWKEYFEELVL